MIGWDLYVRRRGIDTAKFFKGCTSVEQVKQRIESKKVKPPDDATMARLLESIVPIDVAEERKVISIEVRETVSIENLPILTVTVDPPTVTDPEPVLDDEDQAPKRGKGRRRKQTSVDEATDEEDGHE
jgi:hypothetical protein